MGVLNFGDGAVIEEGEAEHADMVEGGALGDGGADAGGALADEFV